MYVRNPIDDDARTKTNKNGEQGMMKIKPIFDRGLCVLGWGGRLYNLWATIFSHVNLPRPRSYNKTSSLETLHLRQLGLKIPVGFIYQSFRYSSPFLVRMIFPLVPQAADGLIKNPKKKKNHSSSIHPYGMTGRSIREGKKKKRMTHRVNPRLERGASRRFMREYTLKAIIPKRESYH